MFVNYFHIPCLQVLSILFQCHKVRLFFDTRFSWIRIIPYIITQIQQKRNRQQQAFPHWQLNMIETIPHFVSKQTKSSFHTHLMELK